MRSPLFFGVQTFVLLLTPLLCPAQTTVGALSSPLKSIELLDTTQSDTLILIERRPLERERTATRSLNEADTSEILAPNELVESNGDVETAAVTEPVEAIEPNEATEPVGATEPDEAAEPDELVEFQLGIIAPEPESEPAGFQFGMLAPDATATPPSDPLSAQQLNIDTASIWFANPHPYVREPEPPYVDSALGAAYLASGVAHMQANEHELARVDFEATLAADPENIQAHNTLGYLNAWSGRHKDAATQFQRALAIDPRNADAAKGLAYVAHYSGRSEEAAARFGALAAEHPDDVELANMHGQSLLAAHRSVEARSVFERALAMNPGNETARFGIRSARAAKPKVELSSWLGVTWFDDEERPKADANLGFRFVEVAIWPTPQSRIWFQYDNGLTLDNVVLSAGNRAVPAGYVGGFINYERQHTTRLELGWRSLPGSVGEVLIRSEHVVTLPSRYALKAGAWLGMRSDDRLEFIYHAGLSIPIGDRFELGPTFFYASNGMINEHEWRILIAGEYRFESDLRLTGGLAGGQASTGYIGDYRGISDRFLKVSWPFGQFNRAHALFRSEFVGETDATTIFAVGVTLGLSER